MIGVDTRPGTLLQWKAQEKGGKWILSHKSKFWDQTWALQGWKLDTQAWGTRDFQGEMTQGMGQHRASGENKEIRLGWVQAAALL